MKPRKYLFCSGCLADAATNDLDMFMTEAGVLCVTCFKKISAEDIEKNPNLIVMAVPVW